MHTFSSQVFCLDLVDNDGGKRCIVTSSFYCCGPINISQPLTYGDRFLYMKRSEACDIGSYMSGMELCCTGNGVLSVDCLLR